MKTEPCVTDQIIFFAGVSEQDFFFWARLCEKSCQHNCVFPKFLCAMISANR